MKKMIIEKITLGITVVSMVAILSGCGSHKEEWAYSHDPAEPVITLSETADVLTRGMSTPTVRTTLLSLLRMIKAKPSRCVTRWMGIR